MILELAAARLIARNLGSSLYTWTAVIGVVLAGISLGNSVGGRVADRYTARKALAVLFAIASAACVSTVILNNLVGGLMWLWELSWPARVFTHVFLVFMIPSTILGTISPVVAKMALDRGLPTGRTVGGIYAWGAIGSIAGTFAAGYWLIDAVGTAAIIWIIGGVLVLMAILYSTRLWPFCICALAFLCAMGLAMTPIDWCRTTGATLALREQPDPTVIYEDETAYSYVSVKRVSDDPDKREFVQDKLTHSKIAMSDITNLQYFYTKIYAAVTSGLSGSKEKLSVLAIGGGGYVFPRYVEKTWPGSFIEVVEIDPGVTKAATAAFGLDPQSSINTVNTDARNYVDQLVRQGREKPYDFIYGDAFNDYSVPFQLLTRQFNDKLAGLLADDGAYMLTVIDIYEQGQFLGAVVATLQQTFLDVHVIKEERMPDWARNTFVVVAAKHKLDIDQILSRYDSPDELWCSDEADANNLKVKAQGLILTDDYAPVENLLAPVVRRSGKGFLADKYMQQAQRLVGLNRSREAIAFYEKAARAYPRLTTIAYSEIGFICFRQADFAAAVEAFKKSIEYNRQARLGYNLARVNFELAVSLENLNRGDEAAEYLKESAELFRKLAGEYPTTPEYQFRLGQVLVKTRDLDAAAEAFKKAVELDPNHLDNHLEYARVLELQERYDDGLQAVQKSLEYMKSKGLEENLASLRALLEVFEFKKWRESRNAEPQKP